MSTQAFIKTRYRVEMTEDASSLHRSGGTSNLANANCPTCKLPLLLMWELNCTDPRLPKCAVGSLSRLPLFFCWSCVNDLCYQTQEGDQLRVFQNERPHSGPNYQYEPYPVSFPERRLTLTTGVPDDILFLADKIIVEGQNCSDDEDSQMWLPKDLEQQLLTRYFGHKTTSPFDLIYHKLGGVPLNPGWEGDFRCPNPDCKGTVSDRLLRKKRRMKFLAGVLNDPHAGLPMVESALESNRKSWNHYISVQFHICDCCYSVTACNRCD